MSNMWALDAETSIYSIIKSRAKEKLIDTYPNVNFTMDNVVNDKALFPTIYIHFLPSVEMGNDLNNTDINAVRLTMQIETAVGESSNSLSDARVVTGVVLDEVKALRFNVTAMPEFFDNTSDVKRMIFRASRVVGAQDIF